MSNHLQEFGKYIKNLREEKGFSSQRILADKIGVSNSTIAKIERGAHEASDETLHKLAEAFDMDYMELLEKQVAGNKVDTELLIEKIHRLKKYQIDMISNIVDEFLNLGGKA
ncbi:helix-turn-helix domain-containing protein [Bacillus rubiinfantis]|uniref:helix-turn-helix domain-containing protein n=1 Tax=Bacillus rubiinfantis TaxID=1499680 RepID=UPI0005A8F2F8|nr:helix-turn-helix transcriptional regulator [Bacillus rubiinfantis]